MILFWYNHSPAGTPLESILGLTLVKRAVLSAQAAGFKKILLACLLEDEKLVRDELEDRRISVEVELQTGTVSPALALEKSVFDPPVEMALALGDRVWATPTLKAIVTPLLKDKQLRLVCCDDSHQPCAGLFRVKTIKMDRLPLSDDSTKEYLENAFDNSEDAPAPLDIVTIDQCTAKVGEGHDRRVAEDLLLQALKKSADGMVSRHINRKISLFLSRYLAKAPIHPNHITSIVALVGIMAGPFAFFMGGYLGFVLGGFCYYISAILDGCDGEISRLKHLGSPMGAWLDTIVDDMVCLSYILGLYGRLYTDSPGPFWMWTGFAGIGFFLLTVLPRYYVMAVRLGSGDFQKLAAAQKPPELEGFGKVVQMVKDVIFRTDFLPFYAFVTALCNFVPAFAVPFAVGSIASAGDTLVTLIKTRPKN